MTDLATKLAAAWKAVEESGVPESLHAVAFEAAWRALEGDAPAGRAVPDGADVGGVADTSNQDSAPPVRAASRKVTSKKDSASSKKNVDEPTKKAWGEDEFFAALAKEAPVDEEMLRQAYFVKGGEWRISATRSRLGATEAERNRSVSLLLAGARWYLEGNPATTIVEIREAASRVPYAVSKNLSTHMNSVPGTIAAGSRRDKSIRVSGSKIDAAFKELIERLAGVTSDS